jgi:natural product precursor
MKKKLEFNKETIIKLDEQAMDSVKGGGFLSLFGCGCGKNGTNPSRQGSCRPDTATDTTCDSQPTSCDAFIVDGGGDSPTFA